MTFRGKKEEGSEMSMEAAIAFYELLEKDPKVADKVRELATPDRIEPYVKKELG